MFILLAFIYLFHAIFTVKHNPIKYSNDVFNSQSPWQYVHLCDNFTLNFFCLAVPMNHYHMGLPTVRNFKTNVSFRIV